MLPDRRQAIDALVPKHFDFLLEKGFILAPEPKKKDRWRSIVHRFLYRHVNWGIEISIGYREADYSVCLVPLLQGQSREVPFGYRTKWALQDYVTRVLSISDPTPTEIKRAWQESSSIDANYTVEFADNLFGLYAKLLTNHLDVIVSSPHPPISKK